MKRGRSLIVISSLLAASLLLSACGSLLNAAEQAVQGGKYGPAYTAQEHQTRTFEALWKYLADNYIYYDTAGVDWEALHAKYTTEIKQGLSDSQFSELIHALEAELPEGALVYQSRSERIASDTADLSTFEGIGAFVSFQKETVPHVVILDVIADSPAEQAGLQAHDSIYRIDGKPVLLEEGQSVVNRIRGPAGSAVTLEVKTPGQSERSIEVTRGKLVNGGQLKVELIRGTRYTYVLFPPVSYQTVMEDLTRQMREISDKQELKGIILDLRIAGSAGGFPLQELLTLFYNGTLGEFYNRGQQTQAVTITGEDQFGSQKIPLVILVGANTSGSPEILAAGLQAGRRASVIGADTPGQVETTDAFLLPDGSRIFIATTSFKLSNGTDVGQNGIEPDLPVPADWDEFQPNNDPVLNRAVEMLDGQK
jgi:carboxyl-terminal processing protease